MYSINFLSTKTIKQLLNLIISFMLYNENIFHNKKVILKLRKSY
jgi:hypothetical protein